MNISKLITSKDKDRQQRINEFYDEHIKNNKTKEQKLHGVVHTPIEIVEFIINSLDDKTRDEFNRSIYDKDVRVFDPFLGTGTFIIVFMEKCFHKAGIDVLRYKYEHDIFCNEIIEETYKIAKLNIEEFYFQLTETRKAYLKI